MRAWFERALLAASLLSALIFATVCVESPLLLYPNANFDDWLYIKLGQAIATGHWLGAFGDLTLARGPGYPLFLAASHFTGLPISLTQAILFALCLAAFCFEIVVVFRSKLLGHIVFILTILHPAFLNERILRDDIYSAQTFLILACVLAAFFSRSGRAWGWGGATGLATGWFWLTREEGVWIAPALALLIVGAFYMEWTESRRATRTATALGSLLIAFAIGQFAYDGMNRDFYGRFQGVDVKEANFRRTLTALQSVTDGDQIPYVPVSKSTRKLIYAVSPTFGSLRDSLDPPSGKISDPGCQFYPQTCGDIAGGWFLWFLREAAAGVGAYQSPETAHEFFHRLADEVESACAAGRLHCQANPIPFMPRVDRAQILDFPEKLFEATKFVINVDSLPLPAPAKGTPQQILDGWEFLNRPLLAGGPDETPASTLQIAALGFREIWEKLYKIALVIVLPCGLAAMIAGAAMVWREKRELRTVVIAAGLWVLLFCRLALVALIEISSFPAINKRYLNPALYLTVPAAVLAIGAFIQIVRDRRSATALAPVIATEEIDGGTAAQ